MPRELIELTLLDMSFLWEQYELSQFSLNLLLS